jgi:hypothetical protein
MPVPAMNDVIVSQTGKLRQLREAPGRKSLNADLAGFSRDEKLTT